jgi:hypothetical protein
MKVSRFLTNTIGIAPCGADQMPPLAATMRRKGAEMMR